MSAPPARVERRLAAILAADVAGYSRLIGADEEGTLARLRALRRELVDPSIAAHKGRIVKTTGDGMLVEFASVVDALRCAVAVQQAMRERNAGVPPVDRIDFRIGIHQGDIVVEDGDIFGDGVNIAARLEALAEPGGICVSGRVQEDAAGRLDLEFEDLGAPELKNIVRPVRVYRARTATLTHPVAGAPGSPLSRSAGEGAERSEAGEGRVAALALPDKPSVAVLPFANMSSDPEQEFFGDGIADDVITALSRYPSLFVIARNSAFTYKGRAGDVKQVGRELGVRYVLEGSLRKAGSRIRVTAQLVEAETGNHVWAERYDRDLADIFAVQDEISEAVTIAIAPAIAGAEQQRAMRKPPGSLDAWTAYQRGLWHLTRAAVDDNNLAQRFFQQAIDRDPNFAGGYSGLSLAQIQAAGAFATRNLAETLPSAESLVRQAIALDAGDAEAHSHLSLALWHRGDHKGALAEARRALAISPNLAMAHQMLGSALAFSGFPEEGLAALLACIRLDPGSPRFSARLTHVAAAHYFRRDYQAAAEAARAASREHPDYPLPYRWLAAALGQLGQSDEAKAALEKAISISPASFDLHARSRVPWQRPEDHAHMVEGLRKAGWEG
jgi:adenylate cyclase